MPRRRHARNQPSERLYSQSGAYELQPVAEDSTHQDAYSSSYDAYPRSHDTYPMPYDAYSTSSDSSYAQEYVNDTREGIQDRKLLFCEYLSTNYTLAELIQVCDGCLQYSARCCQHDTGSACHHFRLIFTDGACAGNGIVGAKAGIGIAMGQIGLGIDQFSLPVTDAMDPGQRRTSQRAELLAAIHGVRRAMEGDVHDYDGYDASMRKQRVIVTDSEYVVRGITEWFPQWRRNGWRTSVGMTPANLDLFQLLDAEIESLETYNNAQFGFWHVPRALNTAADQLARAGAARAAREDI
ncbi:ribonuclease H-like domain-containing protein [Schizophyllum amplum]|uniref:ribonuclease H n=1 Tax=Schizophyllum amplum TaxID=97359 RepID=A0A550CVD6_9AGAR|nr:ribonuclease H-like domain-containing protein [Auriculariopsis ampla]